MCFSAEASFTAAVVLLPAGAITISRAKQLDSRYLGIASLPLLLGVQQLFEGLVWTAGLATDPALVTSYSLAYMFFSWLAWPVWMPASVYFIEPNRRKPIYLVFIVAGSMLGAIQYFPYFAHNGWLITRFLPHAISYQGLELFDFIIGRSLTYIIYVGVVIGPLVLSSDRGIRIFGGLVASVLAVTLAFFQYAYISVFCFGAAIMSLYLVWLFDSRRRGTAATGLRAQDR